VGGTCGGVLRPAPARRDPGRNLPFILGVVQVRLSSSVNTRAAQLFYLDEHNLWAEITALCRT
jgi:hypothetical protein